MMRKLVLLATVLLCIAPAFVFAQTNTAPSSGGSDLNSPVWVNPSFQVGDAIVQQTPGSNTVKGTVTVVNDNAAAFGGVRLEAYLIGPAPVSKPNTIVADDAPGYDRVIFADSYQFFAHEKKTVSFTYTAPSVPAGPYRLRLQVITSNGNDYPLTLGQVNAPFVALSPGPVTVGTTPYTPSEGVNVQPGSPITIAASAKLTGSAASIKVTPVITTYAFDLTGNVLSTTQEEPVTLTSDNAQSQTYSIKVSDNPGAYQTTLVFQDSSGKRISSLIEYRWVVMGITARVMMGRFTALTSTAATAEFEVVGPADGKTFVDTTVSIAMLDGNQVVQQGSTDRPQLGKDGIQSGSMTFSLSSPPKNPGLRIILTNTKTKEVLDTYEVHVPAPLIEATPSLAPSSAATTHKFVPSIRVYAGVAILAIVLLSIALIVRHRIQRNAIRAKLPPLILLLGMVIGAGVLSYATHPADAVNGVIIAWKGNDLSDKYFLNVTINAPIHNNSPATSPISPSSIPVSFVLSYGTCNNKVTTPLVAVYNLHSEGQVAFTGTTYETSTPSSGGSIYKVYLQLTGPVGIVWNTLDDITKDTTNGSFDKVLYQKFKYIECTSDENCTLTRNFTGTLSVPNVADSTTLLWVFRNEFVGEGQDYEHLEAFYTWVNFRVPNNAPVSMPAYSTGGTTIVATQGQPTTLSLTAGGSSDPDGWNTAVRGMNAGGKCDWDLDFTQPSVFAATSTITNPATSGACSASTVHTFNDVPGTYTYQVLRLTDDASAQSNIGTVSVTVVAPTSTPTSTPITTPTPSATPVSGNNSPVSVASMSVNGGTFNSTATVVQGVPVTVQLSANGSSDPDGWNDPTLGVSNGGKCEWNSDLNQGAPTFETTISDPSIPDACQISAGAITFNDAPGTYTYNLLRITDASGAQSNSGTSSVTITILPPGSPTVTPVPTITPTPVPTASLLFGRGAVFQDTK